ncbi:hypothetical protein [Streptomyces sp. NPDC050738]|uniref:hypothetical protein n=1 Tax=Streptomyces sp. NPDC050738 TaxID=3154744 RepID=UPI0034250C47
MPKPSASPSWYELAQPDDRKRAKWSYGLNRTAWSSCGQAWDAVAITPSGRGLDTLAGLRIGPYVGALVLVDHVRGVLYVMVPAGSGDVLAGLPGVRVLSVGNELLLPASYDHSTEAADLISHPRDGDPPTLVPAEKLAEQLRAHPAEGVGGP